MFNSSKFFQVISGFIAFGFTILQGLDWLFKKYSVDSKWFNYIVISLFIAFLASLLILFIKSRKAENQKPAQFIPGKYPGCATIKLRQCFD